jgi:Type I restriction enzyme R protein N terminus (HSDR_N)
MPILNPNQAYTFSKYFELQVNIDELVAEFGYSFSRNKLNLSLYKQELNRLEQLRERIEEILPNVILNNEISRREILISPLVIDLIHYTNAQLRIEYQLKVSEQLQGYLDYLIHNQNNFLVIEAKRENLDSGFAQLVTELIALDQWEKMGDQDLILGAVTTGEIWKFGRLNRQHKHLEQGLESYRVPEDLEELMRILVNILI